MNIPIPDDKTFLKWFFARDDAKAVRFFYQRKGLDDSTPILDKRGEPLAYDKLTAALFSLSPNIFRTLLEMGYPADGINWEADAGTPLTYAVMMFDRKSTDLLLDYGANPLMLDTEGFWMPIMQAINRRDRMPKQVRRMLDSLDQHGWNTCMEWIEKTRKRDEDELCSMGLDPNDGLFSVAHGELLKIKHNVVRPPSKQRSV